MTTERDLWREARRRINECETREAELKLDEQREQSVIQTYEEKLNQLKKDVEDGKNAQSTLKTKSASLRNDLKLKTDNLAAMQSELNTLHLQIEEKKQKLVDSLKANLEEKERLEAHLDEQCQFRVQWESYYSQYPQQ